MSRVEGILKKTTWPRSLGHVTASPFVASDRHPLPRPHLELVHGGVVSFESALWKARMSVRWSRTAVHGGWRSVEVKWKPGSPPRNRRRQHITLRTAQGLRVVAVIKVGLCRWKPNQTQNLCSSVSGCRYGKGSTKHLRFSILGKDWQNQWLTELIEAKNNDFSQRCQITETPKSLQHSVFSS